MASVVRLAARECRSRSSQGCTVAVVRTQAPVPVPDQIPIRTVEENHNKAVDQDQDQDSPNPAPDKRTPPPEWPRTPPLRLEVVPRQIPASNKPRWASSRRRAGE